MEKLNNYQKNSLRASLNGLEDVLHNINRWVKQGEEQGILYTRTLQLQPGVKEKIFQYSQQALSIIKEIMLKYHLEHRQESIAREIMGQISISWANLCDTKSKRLKGYGDMGSTASAELDQDIDSLSETCMSIYKSIDESEIQNNQLNEKNQQNEK